MSAGDDVVALLREGCGGFGFDLAMPLQTGWYNDGVDASRRLEDFGSSGHLSVVIGNTRALWPIWRAALQRDPVLATSPDPLDDYTVRSLRSLMAALGMRSSLRFAHETGPAGIAMQRVAHVAGLAYLTETHLSVHPVHGPWVALRAVVSLALPGPPGRAPRLAHPCGGCERRCRSAFERAVATTAGGPPSEASLRANWQLWVAHRDACPIGREYRYSDAQIRYHYLRELEPASSGPNDTPATTPEAPER